MTAFLELLGVGLGWALLGVPLLKFAIASGRKQPERANVRAIPWALGIGVWTGFVLGAVGFLFGAGIGDESSGEIAVMLFLMGGGVGVPLGGIASWVFIVQRVKRPAR